MGLACPVSAQQRAVQKGGFEAENQKLGNLHSSYLLTIQNLTSANI